MQGFAGTRLRAVSKDKINELHYVTHGIVNLLTPFRNTHTHTHTHVQHKKPRALAAEHTTPHDTTPHSITRNP